jgi:DNA repair protein RecN (Recombination protein N)
MLTELRIRDFAIIHALTLPLESGLNVLSGETGAGKSIIVGALGLLLGERASAELVRAGADRAVVEGIFDATGVPGIHDALESRGIPIEDGTVVLRRELTANGRSRAWINDATVTSAALAEAGRLLANLHGQHEAQNLLDVERQRAILDAFGGAAAEADAVREAYAELMDVRHRIAETRRRRGDAQARADYLRHVDDEINSAHLEPGEDVRLEEEARRLEHADELRANAAAMLAALEGDDDAVLHRLASLQRMLAATQRIDGSMARMQELLDSGFIALEEFAHDLASWSGTIELDPARLNEVQQRRDLLFRLLKKYGPTLDDVVRTGREAHEELEFVDASEFDLTQLSAREGEARRALAQAATALSALRADAARRLAVAVDGMLPELGMPDGRFSVRLTPRDEPGSVGAEDVEFRVTLNAGHDARALAKVASGGELSRVMLALQTILARLDGVPTLVFDEVDAGIGGRVGLAVGDTMRRVAAHHQVFAISHLPQIAARAHHHIVVAKGDRQGVTTADTSVLDGDARVLEIARMLGGDPESAVSQAHARELLAAAGPTGDAALPSPKPAVRTRRRQGRAAEPGRPPRGGGR